MGVVAGSGVDGVRAGSRGLRWADRPLRAKGLIVLALPLLMLVVAAGLFYGTTVEERSAEASVTHTRVVEQQIDDIRGLVLDGETGIRGFLVTGHTTFLQPTDMARNQIPAALAALAALVRDNRVETARVGRLGELLGPGWQLSPAGVPPASDLAGRQEWLVRQKASTDAIRGVLDSMTATEDSLLQARQASANRWRAWAEIGVGGGFGGGDLGWCLVYGCVHAGGGRPPAATARRRRLVA